MYLWLVAFGRLLDATVEGQPDMAWKHQRVRRGAMLEHLAARHHRLRGVGVLGEIPVRMKDLQQMMPYVADEGGAFALALQLEEDVARRMARRGVDLDEVVQPVRAARHEIGLAVFQNRHDAFAERAELGRTF